MKTKAERKQEVDAVIERLHGLVESAVFHWRGSMPAQQPDESTIVAQDRLIARDLLAKADAALAGIS